MSRPEDNQFLKKSKTFCILPWVHLYMNPDAKVYPCCVGTSDTKHPIGDLTKNTVDEVRNGPEAKEIRRALLAGEEVAACQNCYTFEKLKGWSSRIDYTTSREMCQGIDIDKLSPDGDLSGAPLKFIDIRFSNLCNLECRTCGGVYSSKIAKYETFQPEELADYTARKLINADNIISISNSRPGIVDELSNHIDTLRRWYSAGGEPFLHRENQELLTKLIEREKFDVQLSFNSNMTTFKYKSFDYIDAFSKFDDVEMLCSIDFFGAGLEYIRQNCEAATVFKNLELLMEHPNIRITVVCVVSIYNVYYICDFIDYMYEKGYIDKIFALHLSYVFGDYHSPSMLPQWAKDELTAKLAIDVNRESVKYTAKKLERVQNALDNMPGWINAKPPDPAQFEIIMNRIEKNDVRKEKDLTAVFPWLAEVIAKVKNGN